MKESFKGRIEVIDKDKRKNRTIEVDLPETNNTPLVSSAEKNCTAGSQITLKSNADFQSCGITLWGTIPCSEKDFGSNGIGKAHTDITNHLAKMALVFEEKLEQGWLPEDATIIRRGFDKEDFE